MKTNLVVNQESNSDAPAKVPKKNFVCFEKMLEFLSSCITSYFPFLFCYEKSI